MFLLLCAAAVAAQLAGVTVPDTATVGGQSVVLNGMGLREKYYIDVYIGALYLSKKTSSASEAVSSDTAKRIAMHFIYEKVSASQLTDTLREGFAHAPAAPAGSLDQLCSYMADVKAGDVVAFDYAPGTGTTVTVKGKTKGTIPGKDFMVALWSVFLGTSPPTARLKAGMLGG